MYIRISDQNQFRKLDFSARIFIHQLFNLITQINLKIDESEKPSDIWRPPSLSELTIIIFYMELTHLSTEASNYS